MIPLFAAAALATSMTSEAPRPRLVVRWAQPGEVEVRDPLSEALDSASERNGFHGQFVAHRPNWTGNTDNIAISSGDYRKKSSGLSGPGSDRRWRWASVTKQVIAVLVMQEKVAGRIDLDAPVRRYLPDFSSPNADKLTVRQLLRHQSGLPNPDDTAAGKDGVPAYYAPGYKGNRSPLTGYCAGPAKGPIGEAWSYNNCDFIVLGALLEKVTGRSWTRLVEERITRPLGMTSVGAYPTALSTVSGTVEGTREPQFDLAAFGAAAGLFGSAKDLLKFDQALMNGRLLPPAALAELWDGQPQLGFIALGQWAFSAPLKGCAKPVRIIERRGAIGGVQVRNFLLPDLRSAFIAFTDRAEFPFGEVWTGKGFSYDMLGAVACTARPIEQ